MNIEERRAALDSAAAAARVRRLHALLRHDDPFGPQITASAALPPLLDLLPSTSEVEARRLLEPEIRALIKIVEADVSIAQIDTYASGGGIPESVFRRYCRIFDFRHKAGGPRFVHHRAEDWEALKELLAVLDVAATKFDEWPFGRPSPVPADLTFIRQCVERFPEVLAQLNRRHDGRAGFEVVDEYDIQDLLHAMLITVIDDVRHEESTSSIAGGSARADLFARASGVVIELKTTLTRRETTGSLRALRNEIILDRRFYASLQGCTRALFMVYDPGRFIPTPRAFEDDLEAGEGLPIEVYVVC